eukprot:TRINITY_DN12720_c0_g1_i1.p1 TRINITY_DN12720_c0_g1~~TRINITY_DN12720_c0_g1_i1.p1  ORF type:complete len:131 (+),score=29.96 TRINITY_DN12720_c0_g1_i1:42-395(+)
MGLSNLVVSGVPPFLSALTDAPSPVVGDFLLPLYAFLQVVVGLVYLSSYFLDESDRMHVAAAFTLWPLFLTYALWTSTELLAPATSTLFLGHAISQAVSLLYVSSGLVSSVKPSPSK